MNRRDFFSALFTTGLVLKLSRQLGGARATAPTRTELEDLFAERLGFHIRGYVVPNHPLTADYHNLHQAMPPQGTRFDQAQRGKLIRDADGRVRLETYHIDRESGAMIEQSLSAVIVDPVLGESYYLSFTHKLATKRRLSPANHATSNERRSDSWYKNVQATPLGTKMIEGFECHGQLIKGSVYDSAQMAFQTCLSVEDWVSAQLCTPLLIRVSVNNYAEGEIGFSSETVRTLTDIIEGEPDPALFRIPSGFREYNNDAQSATAREIPLDEFIKRFKP
jgi:hypothetical protein